MAESQRLPAFFPIRTIPAHRYGIARGSPVLHARVAGRQVHFVVVLGLAVPTFHAFGFEHLPHADHARTDFLKVRPHAFLAGFQKLIECAFLDAKVTKRGDFRARLSHVVPYRARCRIVGHAHAPPDLGDGGGAHQQDQKQTAHGRRLYQRESKTAAINSGNKCDTACPAAWE